MSVSFNHVVIAGNLTRDVELRYTPGGTAVTDISIAINERRKINDEWVDEPTFVDVTLWARTAEIAAEYLGKGSSVLIYGRLKLETWEASDGSRRSKMKVVCNNMQMLNRRNSGGQTETPSAEPTATSGAEGENIPF